LRGATEHEEAVIGELVDVAQDNPQQARRERDFMSALQQPFGQLLIYLSIQCLLYHFPTAVLAETTLADSLLQMWADLKSAFRLLSSA